VSFLLVLLKTKQTISFPHKENNGIDVWPLWKQVALKQEGLTPHFSPPAGLLVPPLFPLTPRLSFLFSPISLVNAFDRLRLRDPPAVDSFKPCCNILAQSGYPQPLSKTTPSSYLNALSHPAPHSSLLAVNLSYGVAQL